MVVITTKTIYTIYISTIIPNSIGNSRNVFSGGGGGRGGGEEGRVDGRGGGRIGVDGDGDVGDLGNEVEGGRGGIDEDRSFAGLGDEVESGGGGVVVQGQSQHEHGVKNLLTAS